MERYQGDERNDSLEKTPFKSFNLNVQEDYEGKKENLEKLFGELKSYLKTKDEFTKRRPKSYNIASDKRSTAGRENELSVPVLIKPQVTNLKEFNRKLEKDESRFDPKVVPFKSPKIQRKLMENVFQPIKCEDLVSKMSGNSCTKTGTGNFENKLFSKSDKTIHESLRMSKTKRRKSLPSFEEPKESSESLSNIENENSKSYNISYYTSFSKGKQSDTGSNEYYSSSLNYSKGRKESEKLIVYPLKSVSDDYVYGANKSSKRDYMKLPTSVSTDSIKQDCGYYTGEISSAIPKRISVTEPSSPAAAYTSNYSVSNKVLRAKNDNAESDISESESECNTTPIVSKVRKSKSFVEQKASKRNYDLSYNSSVTPLQAKNSKGSKVRIGKLSRSSTSSCDSFCPSQSQKRSDKMKGNKSEIENTRPYKKYETNSLRNSSKKKRGCGCEENLIDLQKDKGRYKDGFEKQVRKPPERVRSATREMKNRDMPSSSRMNAEMYLHLLDVLLQKNQSENKDLKQEVFTKSLPRNHKSKYTEGRPREFAHYFPTALQCEKTCLKIVKSVPEGGSPVSRNADFTSKKKPTDQYQRTKDKRLIETERESCSGRRMNTSIGRCACAPYACYNAFCTQQRGKYSPKEDYKSEGIRIDKSGRTKNDRRNEDECVLRIEDEKLWIKICKAVEEVNFKEKNLRKSD